MNKEREGSANTDLKMGWRPLNWILGCFLLSVHSSLRQQWELINTMLILKTLSCCPPRCISRSEAPQCRLMG